MIFFWSGKKVPQTLVEEALSGFNAEVTSLSDQERRTKLEEYLG